jgi:HK97 family phage major capsid protein
MPDTDLAQDILQKLADVTNAVKENGGLNGLNKDELMKDFNAALKEHDDAMTKNLMENLPVRMGDLATPAVQRAAMGYTGKYAHEVKEIAQKGYVSIGNRKVMAIDFQLAKLFIDSANKLKTDGKGFENDEKLKPASEDLNEAVKALNATTSGAGAELVPTGMAAQLWQDFFMASKVVGDMGSIPMPTNPFDIPLNLGDVVWRKGTPNQGAAGTDVTTAKSTLTATEQVAEIDWAYDLDEDAVVAIMPALRQRLAISGAEQMDAFALNADSTVSASGTINSTDATPPADSYFLTNGQDGIRHLALIDNTNQASSAGAAISDAIMATGMAKLGKYGLDKDNIRIVPDAATYLAMLGMTNIATLEKYGPQATILTGELARYRGIPVLPSASMQLTYTDGKVAVATPANNTKGQIAIYNRAMWASGFRRGMTIEVDRIIQRRMLVMVVSFRIAVAAYGTRSTAKHTVVIYNIG